LRTGVAQGAVMIELGEAEVLERQQPQPFHRRLDTRRARGDAFQQLAQSALIDDSAS
jgi:hypothetical protein